MGCIPSLARSGREADGRPSSAAAAAAEIVVFAPGMRAPGNVDFSQLAARGLLPAAAVDRLCSLRSQLVALLASADETHVHADKQPSKSSKSKPTACTLTQHGGTSKLDIQIALEDYLPLLLGLVKRNECANAVCFVWTNQEDPVQETAISSASYELLSVVHLMAVLGLMQANALLSSKPTLEDCPLLKTNEDRRKEAIATCLKVSGTLEYALNTIIQTMPTHELEMLPLDLRENVLSALSLQALGQCVEIQLGLAIDNLKATLAVKRRLACEQVKYWQQAYDNISSIDLGGVWGVKHQSFIHWKLSEAKAAAYYFHGLVLDEGSEADTHAKGVACLQRAEACLKESQKLCATFCLETPLTRPRPLWGAMKWLTEKIPQDYASKARICRQSYSREKAPERILELPDFALSLHPEEIMLPEPDPLQD